MTAASALLGRCLRGGVRSAAPLGYRVAAIVAASFVGCSVLVTLDDAGTLPQAPGGFLERVGLYAGMGWLGAAAVHLLVGPRR